MPLTLSVSSIFILYSLSEEMPKLHTCKIAILSSTVFVCVLPSTSVNLVVPRGADCKVISDVMKGVWPELVAETSARALVDEVATNERAQVIIVLGDAVLSGGIAAKAMLEEKMLASIIVKIKTVEILFIFFLLFFCISIL